MSWPYQSSQTPTCRHASFGNVILPFPSPTYTEISYSLRLLHPAHYQTPPPTLSSSPLSPTMRFPLLAAWLGLTTTSLAHNIQMGAHQRECFHEVLHRDDKMTVTFQVGDREFGGAGNLEIDFWVGAPFYMLGKTETALSGQRQTRASWSSVDFARLFISRKPWLQSSMHSLCNTR